MCLKQMQGYTVALCAPLEAKLRCPLCHLLMREPVQTIRGELACEWCYAQATSDGLCPLDGEPISSAEFYVDRFVKREIQSLECFCLNKELGCPWIGTIGGLQEHCTQCEHRPIKCSLCDEQVPQSMMTPHLEACPKLLLEGKCIYPECSFRPVNVGDLKCHLENDVIGHAMLHARSLSNMQQEFKVLLELQERKAKEREGKLEEEMQTLKNRIALFMKKAEEIQEDSEKKISSMQKMLTELQNQPVTLTAPPTSSVGDIPAQLNVLTKDIKDLDLRQQLTENTSYDGKLLWKIDNVSKRLNQAIIGKVTALHSAPTFTSRYGYKFCGRLYLNGDGIGKGTHASMFFVLMKSEYDSLLEWPFNKRITMRLVNQRDRKEDLVECFDTDVNSSSFLKPHKDMNVASGCPLFVAKDNLLNGGFIKDDIMYVELNIS